MPGRKENTQEKVQEKYKKKYRKNTKNIRKMQENCKR